MHKFLPAHSVLLFFLTEEDRKVRLHGYNPGKPLFMQVSCNQAPGYASVTPVAAKPTRPGGVTHRQQRKWRFSLDHLSLLDTCRASVTAVESHHPSPANQQVSSGDPSRRSERTRSQFFENASVNPRPASSSWRPTQPMKPARPANFAGHVEPWSGRVTSNMPPSTPWGAKGNKRRPPGRNASSHVLLGRAAPAQT